jgi:hypothetical protein
MLSYSQMLNRWCNKFIKLNSILSSNILYAIYFHNIIV